MIRGIESSCVKAFKKFGQHTKKKYARDGFTVIWTDNNRFSFAVDIRFDWHEHSEIKKEFWFNGMS